jgi:hypothetical protein
MGLADIARHVRKPLMTRNKGSQCVVDDVAGSDYRALLREVEAARGGPQRKEG